MKVLYSQIKDLVPDLKLPAKETGNILTSIGFMMDDFKEVYYDNKKDFLLSLEIRQNRADCLSVFGLAKEIAAHQGCSIKLPALPTFKFNDNRLDIEIKATDYLKSVHAVSLKKIENKKSPNWLKEYLSFYDVRSINLLVDLSNYVMILTGYPSHVLDADKIDGQIIWSLNNTKREFITLDSVKINLEKGELVIEDKKNILALAGIVGGRHAAIGINTNSIIVELAVYKHSIIRNNSRSLNIATEASNRLGKQLDPNGSNYAFGLLLTLIKKYCKGEFNSNLFHHYPQKYTQPGIIFNPGLPSAYAGIDIPIHRVETILKNLGFVLEKNKDKLKVIPPDGRMDILCEEDAIEEVIRMNGYEKIPTDEVPKFPVVKNITSKIIVLSDKIRDILSSIGLDEILSWPLTKTGDNKNVNYLDWGIVRTQNSVNEDFPELRQSIGAGLINQYYEFDKKNIKLIRIFEIGKTYGRIRNKYIEYDSLGILVNSPHKEKGLSMLQKFLEILLRSLGFSEIKYLKSKVIPKIANPYTCWDVYTNGSKLGIIYKLKQISKTENAYFTEINLNEVLEKIKKINNHATLELKQKLIILDANIELDKNDSINEFVEKIKSKIGLGHIWSIVVIDKFALAEKTRYTIRVIYYNLSDQEAKKIHLEVFNLR